MGGLIPLALNSSGASRSSILLSDDDHLLKRRSSMASKRKSVKHPLQRPLPPLRAIPFTSTEWKKTLAEIKREFQNRKYRECSSKCQEILDNMRSSEHVEPTYLVYLRFYAANALEMQVRSLHHSSPYRTKMLLRAREHYQNASDLAKVKDEAMSRVSCHKPSPLFSDLDSPTTTNTSHSTITTRDSSPEPPLHVVGCNVQPLEPVPKRKRHVAFCDDMPGMEPFIRPDSPTLGFDAHTEPSSPEPLVPELFLLPEVKSASPSQIMSPTPVPVPVPEPKAQDSHEDVSLRARSINRFCAILASLQRQISSHLAILDIDIAASQNPQPPPSSNDEMRALELQARIERLRANGWQRKRFDPKRYEALRDSAMADMMQ